MKKPFYLSFQLKVVLGLLLLINLPFFIVYQFGLDLVEDALTHEKENKLMAITRVLDSIIGPAGYDGILRSADMMDGSRDEKIKAINIALRGAANKISQSSEGLALGYYSKELDAILVYGPSSLYSYTIGLSIPEDHPGRKVMETNTPLVARGTMVRGNIMNAMFPLEREGKVIGYIWANELEEDVQAQLKTITRDAEYTLTAGFLITVIVLIYLSQQSMKGINSIISGVRIMQNDLSHRLPPLKGEFNDVASSLNDMAENLHIATSESERAVAVLQGVMNNLEAAIVVCDPATRRIVYANPYMLHLWNVESLENRACYAALYGFSKPCADCPQVEFFQGGVPNYEATYQEKYDARLDRDFLVADRLISWHDGRIVHLRVATDITDRKALLAAETANKAQREFLARMSHEIRTPMNGVLGMTRLAIQEGPDSKQLEYLNKIQSSAVLLLGIINDILDFSRIEAGAMTIEKKPFLIHEIVQKVHELVLPRAKENNSTLNVHIDSSVPKYVMGDSLRISQVLLNLLGNATKFTADGEVKLKMHAMSLANGYLRIHCDVSDSGIGMTKQQQKELFKPFTQADTSTSRKFGGTGLGLSICKALVELMNGQISVSSEEGNGSTFSFFVELEPYDEEIHAAILEAHPWDGVRYDGCQCLLVEDNSLNQEIALAILAEFGIEADVANDGKEAVAAFMKRDYDLILMDMRMPVMDGIEATVIIRGSEKHDARTVPIVAMTANAMAEDREESKAIGMNGHIAKPIDLNELQMVFYDCLVVNKKDRVLM